MTFRFAAGCLAVAAVIAAPAETFARGGSFGGGRPTAVQGGAAHGSFRARVARPMAPLAAPAVSPPLVPRATASSAARSAPAHVLSAAHFRHRRFYGAGWPLSVWGDAPWYAGGYDDPADTLAGDGQPASGYPPAYSYPAYPPADAMVVRERIYVMPFRPGCGTQTYRVPAEGGGRRTINVVRC